MLSDKTTIGGGKKDEVEDEDGRTTVEEKQFEERRIFLVNFSGTREELYPFFAVSQVEWRVFE